MTTEKMRKAFEVIESTIEGRHICCDIDEEVWRNLQDHAGCTSQEADAVMEVWAGKKSRETLK